MDTKTDLYPAAYVHELGIDLIPASASEQGNVIGLDVRVYVCVPLLQSSKLSDLPKISSYGCLLQNK